MSLTLCEIDIGSPEYHAAVRLREKVLRAPLGLVFSEAELAVEPDCFHLAAIAEGEVVAILLLQPIEAGTVRMRQVAVNPDRQRSGSGSQLVRFAEGFAREHGFRRMVAHARGTAVGFYQRLGYATEGESFMENTIPHVLVAKALE